MSVGLADPQFQGWIDEVSSGDFRSAGLKLILEIHLALQRSKYPPQGIGREPGKMKCAPNEPSMIGFAQAINVGL